MDKKAVGIVCLVCALVVCGLVNPARGQLSAKTPFSFQEDGEVSLDVWGGRDLHAALSVAHLARDVVGLRIRAGFHMREMVNLPATSISRDLWMSGVAGDRKNKIQIIDAGNCETKVHVEPGVKLVVKSVGIDVRGCKIPDEEGSNVTGLPGWLCRLGVGSELVYKDLTIVLSSTMLREIEQNAGKSIQENSPQNLLLKSKDGSNRVVAFRNVVFSVRSGTAIGGEGRIKNKKSVVEREQNFPVIEKVTSEKELKKALARPRTDAGPVEIYVQNNISFSDRPLFSKRFGRGAERGGSAANRMTNVFIKSGEEGVTTLAWPSSFFSSSIFSAPGTELVSLKNITIDSPEFLPPMPSCFNEDCLRSAWAAFPPISEGYPCKFLMKNVTIRSSCQSIRHTFQTLMFANFWKGRTLEEVQNISYEVPYVEMDRVGDDLLRIHAFARMGLCMEDVLVKCGELALTSSSGYHRVQESSGTSIVFISTVSLGLLGLFLCVIRICGRGGRKVPRVRWMMGSKTPKSSEHSQSSDSLTGSLHTSYITASSMPVPSEPVFPLSDRSCWSHRSVHSERRGEVETGSSAESRGTSIGGRVSQKSLDWKNDVVQIEEQIGIGGYGIVYRGKWKELDVAVKTVDFQDCPGENGKQRRRAILEASISASVAHHNIVQTLAYCFKPIKEGAQKPKIKLMQRRRVKKGRKWKMYIVQEYCDASSLRAALRQRILQNSVIDRTVDLNRVLRIALDIAQGMEHLHSHGIIHGDLTSKNILLKSPDGSGMGEGGTDLTAKIGDFGLSVKVRDPDATVYNNRAGTPFYIAPEVYHDGLLSKRADVYSFGVLLWELYHQRAPFEKKPEGGYRYHHRFPKFPVHCPMPYALLCVICLSPRMKERPEFSFVKRVLERMLEREAEWKDHDKMESENTRLSAELEGQSVSELHSFVAHLLGDIDGGPTRDLHSPARDSVSENGNSLGMPFAQVSQDRMRFRSNIGSLTQVASSELSMRNGEWERRVEEIIASGTPLSVTVLPPEAGTSDSGTGNWSGSQSRSRSQSLSKTCSRNSQCSSPSSHGGSGGSNALPVTNHEDLWMEQSGSSCGELKFRWSPEILASQEPVVSEPNKGKPNDNARPKSQQKSHDNHETKEKGEAASIYLKEDGAPPADHVAVQVMSCGDIVSNERTRQDREDEDRLLRLALPPMVSRGATEFQLEPRALDGEIDGDFAGVNAIENGFQGRCWLDWDDWEDSSTELMFEYTSPPEGVFNGIYLSQNPLFSLSPREG
ncbi:hypothetical protein BSKO_08853 [Bryopsis sp. KO-2023]|nr:hypothetical protein BSKO_08853 [Bryopsis sp. KO-2023]